MIYFIEIFSGEAFVRGRIQHPGSHRDQESIRRIEIICSESRK